jgi:hypothetical protein
MESGGVQSRVRRLLIRALSHLDLTHNTTLQAVASAVIYIRSLLPDSDYAEGPGRLAAKQWNQLRALVSCIEPAVAASCNPEPPRGPWGCLRLRVQGALAAQGCSERTREPPVEVFIVPVKRSEDCASCQGTTRKLK